MVFGDWIVACAAVLAGLTLRTVQRGEWAVYAHNLATEFSPAGLWVIGGGTLFSALLLFFQTYEVGNVYRLHCWTKNLLKSALLWPLIALAILGFTRAYDLTPRLGLIYCVGTLFGGMVLWRLFAYVFLIQPQVKLAASSRIIVVGWNERATRLRRAMRVDMAQLGEIIGCVPAPGGRFDVAPPPDVAVLGDYSDLPRLVRMCEAHAIILADVSSPAREIQQLISFCHREMLGFELVPEYFPALGSKLQVRTVRGVPLLGISSLPLDRTFNRVFKRLVDIVGGLFGLALAAPVIVVFAALVCAESPGSVIFRQRRTSRCGRIFFIYKIRSMRLDAEGTTGAVWAKQDDPRRLKIGAFMRKWNIDELPQFWNVVKGDMSIVGPRPERPELIERFKDEIPNYNVRHEVRTGLTGWAQIHGLRGDTDLRKRIEHDIHYLENWSPLLDLYCMVATVFKNKNAY